jgi:hypothetical protein
VVMVSRVEWSSAHLEHGLMRSSVARHYTWLVTTRNKSFVCAGRRATHQRPSPTCRTRRSSTSSHGTVCSSRLFFSLLVILRSCLVMVTPFPVPLHTS